MVYAKSNPAEKLGEHTQKLIDNFGVLKESYGKKLEFDKLLDLLYTAVLYHDAGKVYSGFQNMVIKSINRYNNKNIALIDTKYNNNFPHNFLSPAFLPVKDLDNKFSSKLTDILIQAIAFHHEKDIIVDKNFKLLLKEIIENDLEKYKNKVKSELDIKIPDKLFTAYEQLLEKRRRIKEDSDNYYLYILLKGLLHKLDYSASAHRKVELDTSKNIGEYTKDYLSQFESLREVQKKALEHQEDNMIIIASTGMGKTETALLWIDKDKSFFTLPLRVSINALYDRVTKEMGFSYAGLLHSTNIDYLEENSYQTPEDNAKDSKLLSKKLTFSTIDQILKFPLKYRGYEKEYATLAYSKVVIDEIQAYNPEISAVLLKSLEMINNIGGQFMIMTATLPQIYLDFLEKKGLLDNNSYYGEFLTDTIRHKISIEEKALLEDKEEIIDKSKDNQVLVIVNTIAKAKEVFNQLKNKSNNVNLLHSNYIKKDRAKLEKKIKEFSDKNEESGIWITTQLVEASIDIDFDYLFTDLPSLDSLFQRLGRCFRGREYNLDEPNVYIYTKEVEGVGSIYDEHIWFEGLKEIRKYDNKKITEEDKVKLVRNLYSRNRLKGSDFLERFDNALSYLDRLEAYDRNSQEAQEILRNIESRRIIPDSIYQSEVKKLFEDYQQAKSFKLKNKIKREIKKYTLDIGSYKIGNKVRIKEELGIDDIVIVFNPYDFDNKTLIGEGLIEFN